MALTHDKYFKYDELTAVLRDFAANYSQYVKLSSIGQTEQGREIWIMTVTDEKTGSHSEKPAFWVDGNTHATELSGCQACVHLIETLVTKTSDRRIKELLEKVTFYIIPRISVDGAEHVLTTGSYVRSTNTIYPGDEPRENFIVKDLDGDGEVLMMRIPDPSGFYKVCKEDPRLMIPREATDFSDDDGPYYHLFNEGEFQNFDGFTRQHVDPHRFDLNRQSPALFSPKEYGAGPLPMYLKEAQALAKAFVERPNIVGAHTHHTFGGFLLRPSSSRPDSDFPTKDLEVYKLMGQIGEAITGYKHLSVFHDFKYDPKAVTTGAWDDWHYDHRGVYSWTPEIWSLANQAGVKKEKALEIYQNPGADNLLKMLKWCEANLPKGSFYKDWQPYNHPQLGPIEIGGWRTLYTWSNPPHKFLKGELEKLTEFTLKQAQMSPQVRIKDVKITKIDGEIFNVKVMVQNTGFLPTYVSETAKSLNVYKSPFAELKISSGQSFIEGKEKVATKHLTGRADSLPWITPIWGNDLANTHEEMFSWIVKGKGLVLFEGHYGGGGVVKRTITLA